MKPYFAPCHSKNLHTFYQSSWGITKIIKKIFLVTRNERVKHINPFLARAPILYPLKTPENQIIFGVFRGYKIWILARNGLNSLTPVYHCFKTSQYCISYTRETAIKHENVNVVFSYHNYKKLRRSFVTFHGLLFFTLWI